MNASRLARWLVLGAGAMDFLTGLGLVFAPVRVLPLMGVPAPGMEALAFLRWVGAFVGAVGAVYLWGFVRWRRLRRAVLELTVFFRLAAGIFCAGAILRGWLPPAWWSVPGTDLTLVAVQAVLLAKGAGRHD